jgi:cytochrome c2
MIRTGASLAMLTATAGAGDVTNQGSAGTGQTYARDVCAECHSVEPGAKSSPEVKAPPFAVIAKDHGLTVSDIEGWLVSSHRHMPDFSVPPGKRADLIAYIKSLAVKP